MWDQRYAAPDYFYGTEPNDFLRAEVARVPAGLVLCIGDGEGRNGVWLAQQGRVVTAVDASAVGLQKARTLAAARNVPLALRVDFQGLRIEHGVECEREVLEGTGHRGRSAVVQFVARKP